MKVVMKNLNFAPLTCKLVSVQQTACRMACRWQHSADARTSSQYQYKDGCPTWDLHQWWTALCYSVFCVVKVWNLLKFIEEWRFSTVMHVCHRSKSTNGVGSSQMVWLHWKMLLVQVRHNELWLHRTISRERYVDSLLGRKMRHLGALHAKMDHRHQCIILTRPCPKWFPYVWTTQRSNGRK